MCTIHFIGIDTCRLQPESGACLAYFPRYFYNSASGMCERFVYGGCGGNENRFRTIEDCQAACGQSWYCRNTVYMLCCCAVSSLCFSFRCKHLWLWSCVWSLWGLHSKLFLQCNFSEVWEVCVRRMQGKWQQILYWNWMPKSMWWVNKQTYVL